MPEAVLGLIGGSGLYELPFLTSDLVIDSPWGVPSDTLRVGVVDGLRVVFLPRHGRGHRLSPTDIPYRANIDVLKRAGVTSLLSVSACGSFREALAPGTFILVDQYIDRTVQRESSFFGAGCVAHVSMAKPVSPLLVDAVVAAASKIGISVQRGGTYLCMEGPQFSSLAESLSYQAMGCDVIGMTNMPEAKLAREAELCYASLCMVTDYDCWHPSHGAVEVTKILHVLLENARNATQIVTQLVADFPRVHQPCPVGSDSALDYALVTAPQARDPVLLSKLDAVAGRVLSMNRDQ